MPFSAPQYAIRELLEKKERLRRYNQSLGNTGGTQPSTPQANQHSPTKKKLDLSGLKPDDILLHNCKLTSAGSHFAPAEGRRYIVARVTGYQSSDSRTGPKTIPYSTEIYLDQRYFNFSGDTSIQSLVVTSAEVNGKRRYLGFPPDIFGISLSPSSSQSQGDDNPYMKAVRDICAGGGVAPKKDPEP